MKNINKTGFTGIFIGPSLARNITFVIVLCVVFISGTSLSVFIAVTSRIHKSHFEQERVKHISFLTDNLQLPLWNYDSMAVKKIGEIMMKTDTVAFVSIKDAKGNLIFLADNSLENKDFSQTNDIVFRGKKVGSFQMGVTDAGFTKQQKDLLIAGLVNILIIIIGVMAAVVFCIHRFLQKPLSDFSAQIKSVAGGNYNFNKAMAVYPELEGIFENIQKMSVKIKNRQNDLIQSNKKLQGEIDKQRKTEQLLRESEQKYRSMNDNIPVGFFRINVDGKIIEYNSFLLNLLNIPAEHDIGQYNGESFYKNPLDRKEMIRRTIKEKEINGFECRIKKGNGEIAWVSISARAIEDHNGNVLYIDGVFEDISEKKVREEKLMQFAKVIEQADEEVVITSPQGVIQYVNPSFEQNTGYSSDEVIGRKPSILKSGLHDNACYKELWNTILDRKTWKGVLKNKKKNDGIIIHDMTITPIFDSNNTISAYVSIRRDITKRQEIEKQLQQSQKMQAIGTLAGGIAHDFNNILSGIFGYSQIAQINIENQEKILDCLSNIVEASKRATDLVQQILTFSRQTDYKKLPLCVYLEINEALKLIRSSIPVNIKIQNNLNSRSLISADPTKIHQVVMNLCTNAYHAMERTGGALTVSLDDIRISQPKFLREKTMPSGKYLSLKIIDTGCGMDAETLEKAFEPYFTTKKIGHGTGLGLPIVQAIVDEHEGFLDVSSSIGKGTEFSIYFPIVENSVRGRKSSLKSELELNGTETIMLVDDEKAIRESCKDILERHGYDVVVFSDGLDAIEAFMTDPNRFDLVVTDMTMPEKTGSELVKFIRSMNTAIPVVICSGFSNLMDETIARQIGADKYLMKPYQTGDLITEIRNLLKEK